MVVIFGESRLAEDLVRDAVERGLGVVREPEPESETPSGATVVLAEGTLRLGAARERAIETVTLRGGALVWVTSRAYDDPDVVALRRSGLPYTIVRVGDVVDTPEIDGTPLVLVPSDVGREPFVTSEETASFVGDLIEDDEVGSGRSHELASHEGAAAWADALRDLGASAYVVPAWVALLAALFGVRRLELEGGRAALVAGVTSRSRSLALPQ